MMTLDPAVAVAIVALISSIGGIFITNRFAARSARAAQESAERQKTQAIDSLSFKRARDNYDAAIAEQERRIARLHAEMEAERQERQQDDEECKQKIEELRRDLTALREWSRPLLRAARAAGISHPDPPIWLGDGGLGPTEGNL